MSGPERGAGLSYRDAGVDRDAAERAKLDIAELIRTTAGPEVLAGAGAFGGQYRLPTGMRAPVLVASADGVGTKLKVAIMAGRHDTVGADLVNHCVNDILVEGARPLFFMDYIGLGALDEGVVRELVAGMAGACRENGCALLGGEAAQMPDFYDPGEYDLAGFIVGIVEEDGRPGSHRLAAGDALIALAADGFHTNGYSLLRRILFDRLGLSLRDAFPGVRQPVADVLLRIHRSYLKPLRPLIDEGTVRALAHITGGGIPGNLDRVLPASLDARIDRATWEVPAEFRGVADAGGVSDDEMWATFNMGVGMIVAVAEDAAAGALSRLEAAGERAWRVGTLVEGAGAVRLD
jgi:phosphoribosylformylglycinamidine cyclo-ligase